MNILIQETTIARGKFGNIIKKQRYLQNVYFFTLNQLHHLKQITHDSNLGDR